MMENKAKKKLREGKVVIGTMVSEVRFPGIGVMMGVCGFDYLYIDSEHSCYDLETVADIAITCRAANIVPIVRVPSKENYFLLSRPLDSGAMGLLIPQVETKQDAEMIVRSTRYYPQGERGLAPRRIHTDYATGNWQEILNKVNEEVIIIVQIESKKAVENLSEILSVKGIDAAFVGPADLSQSLGIPGQMEHPLEVEYIRRVINVCNDSGIPPGIHMHNLAGAKRWIDEGMKLIAISNDINMLIDTGTKNVNELHGYLKEKGIQ